MFSHHLSTGHSGPQRGVMKSRCFMPRLTAQPPINPNPNIVVHPAVLLRKHNLSHHAQMDCYQDNQYSNGNKRLYCPLCNLQASIVGLVFGQVSLYGHFWEQFAIRLLSDQIVSVRRLLEVWLLLVHRRNVFGQQQDYSHTMGWLCPIG